MRVSHLYFSDLDAAAYPYPGKSTKVNSPSLNENRFISLVRPGVDEVLASLFCLARKFINDDFPTLERPTTQISEPGKPSAAAPYFDASDMLVTNRAFFIIIGKTSSNQMRATPNTSSIVSA